MVDVGGVPEIGTFLPIDPSAHKLRPISSFDQVILRGKGRHVLMQPYCYTTPDAGTGSGVGDDLPRAWVPVV
jgi:hypothetical protein